MDAILADTERLWSGGKAVYVECGDHLSADHRSVRAYAQRKQWKIEQLVPTEPDHGPFSAVTALCTATQAPDDTINWAVVRPLSIWVPSDNDALVEQWRTASAAWGYVWSKASNWYVGRHVARLWLFWQNPTGTQKPAYIALCHETIRRNSGIYDVRVLDSGAAQRLVPDFSLQALQRFQLAHKADILRVYLVHRYGGFWVDSDTILPKPFSVSLVQSLAHNDYVGVRDNRSPYIWNGFFGAPPQSRFLKQWWQQIERYVRMRRPPHGWLLLGAIPATKVASRYAQGRVQLLPFDQYVPVHWNCAGRFGTTDETILEGWSERMGSGRTRPQMIALFNHCMGDGFRARTRDQLLRQDKTLVAHLFRLVLDPGDHLVE